MERLAVAARLKPGTEGQAERLIAAGPPFDPAARGFTRHNVFLSESAVVFVFEAPEVDRLVDDLLDRQFAHPLLMEALESWQPLIDGQPEVASEKFFWEESPPAAKGG
jgi:hypothetical protein